jgi:2-polyprenyl-6-methoxyphenol hydroxylase-like FAD-dependent oxidoreductase
MIGADGIGSIVRPHVLAGRPGPVNFSGAVSISCMVDRKDVNFPSDLVLPAFLYTRSGTILVFALDPEGQKLQWATSIKVPDRPRSEWEEYRTSGQAVADIKRDWDRVKMDPVRSMLDHLDQDNVRLWAPYEVADLPTWHTDRVCLLGDAAHAIPPSAGQGAAQGFEDVGVLSRMLTSSRNNYKEAFEKYELARRPRIDMVRKMTAGAEGTRAKTSSSLTWWVKRNIIRVGLQVSGYGKKGYVEGTTLNAYDATTA